MSNDLPRDTCFEHVYEILGPILDNNKRWNGILYFDQFFLNVYLRVTQRYNIQNVRVNTIEIGNVQVKVKKRNGGYFTRFLTALEKICKLHKRWLFIECVHSEYLVKMLEKREGYEKDVRNEYDVHFWLKNE